MDIHSCRPTWLLPLLLAGCMLVLLLPWGQHLCTCVLKVLRCKHHEATTACQQTGTIQHLQPPAAGGARPQCVSSPASEQLRCSPCASQSSRVMLRRGPATGQQHCLMLRSNYQAQGAKGVAAVGVGSHCDGVQGNPCLCSNHGLDCGCGGDLACQGYCSCCGGACSALGCCCGSYSFCNTA